MIEKNEGVWTCKVCGKTAVKRQHIKTHAEKHIDGMVFACQICTKTFTNRANLVCHISNNHTGLFSCDSCEKASMTRSAFNQHKRRAHHEILS